MSMSHIGYITITIHRRKTFFYNTNESAMEQYAAPKKRKNN